jgi:23S rRNA (uracil1939-C5)-methyltransferase
MVRICKHFGDCGGCSVFDEDYASEVGMRQQAAADILSETIENWSQPVELQHELSKRPPRHFRNRVLYPVQSHPRQGLVAGLYRQGTHEIVEIDSCETQDPDLTELSQIGLRLAKEMELVAYDEKTGKGFLRAFDLRVIESTGEALFTIVTAGGLWDRSQEYAQELKARAEQIERPRGRRPFELVGILRNLNDEKGNRVLGRKYLPLLGRDYQMDRVGKPLPKAKKDRKGVQPPLWLRVSAGSFYQSHKKADLLLYKPMFEALTAPGGSFDGDESIQGKRVVDAYAGVGSFGLRAARAGASRIEIIEESPRAMKDAVENFRRNGFTDQANFRVGRTAESLTEVKPGPHLLILDPPRAGLQQEGIEAVLALKPRFILYVSCHVPSLARDSAALIEGGGWEHHSIRAADIFPRTQHLELVTLLGPRQ